MNQAELIRIKLISFKNKLFNFWVTVWTHTADNEHSELNVAQAPYGSAGSTARVQVQKRIQG